MSTEADQAQQIDQNERSLFHQTPGEPYAYLQELRETCPVYYDPLLRGYFLTTYDDVFEVMSNAERFRLQTRPEEQYTEHQSPARVATFRKMLREATLAPYVETIVAPELDRCISAFEQTGRVEIFAELANPFPAHVIARLFGLPERDFANLITYRDARSAVFNAPPDATDVAELAAKWQAWIDGRMAEVIAEHRAAPADDLTTYLLNATEDGEPIPDEQIIQIAARDLLMAGSETSTRSICNAVYRLLATPGIYEQLRTDRSLIHGFVEESLRYDPPVQIFWRAPNEDVELSGCPIAKDKQIYTSIAGANRDPVKFTNPDEFDITRKIGRHMTFSMGPHRCPGAWLGRGETEMVIAALIDRLPNLRLDPDSPAPELQEVVLRNWRPLHLLFDPS